VQYSSSAPPDTGMRQTNTSASLSTLVYRSRAVAPLSRQDLQGLMQAAQARNRREAITGVMLYHDSLSSSGSRGRLTGWAGSCA
jgi:hypothetical protein